MIVTRPSFDDWGLIVALGVSVRGDCRRKKVGAVIVDARNRVVITGYNGSPPGGPSCLDGACPRAFTGVEPGSSYDTGPGTCIALHAEQNCAIFADPSRLPGATMYITAEPCPGCARMLAGMGLARTVWGPPSEGAVSMLLAVLTALAPEPPEASTAGYRPHHLPGCPARDAAGDPDDCTCPPGRFGPGCQPIWNPGDEPEAAS